MGGAIDNQWRSNNVYVQHEHMRYGSIKPRRWVVVTLGLGLAKSSLPLFDLLVHQISPQRQLGPSRDIFAGMQ